ncbi:hypothetical protein JF535_07145 [Microbulbifer salipaludis]|uniref:Uncharacterized protein n=1 Tax=Microbulbifer salipaludis TaxID=187980 RepID=A0ABS3E5Q1_9GAMM|nr:hypothetical protein [Microbulbifer salipaludis]MBN8430623.1 hypothetical protein [Microbulbifer salipaludis]
MKTVLLSLFEGVHINAHAGKGFDLDPEQHLPQEIKDQLQGAWQGAKDAYGAAVAAAVAEDELPAYPGDSWVEGFLDYRVRPVAGGARDYQQSSDTFRIASGLRRDLANGWSWYTFASYGKNSIDNVTYNSYNKARLNEIFSGEAGLDFDFTSGISPEIMNYFHYDDPEDNQ